MIVNKPQFDTEKIVSGSACWMTKYNYRRYPEINTPCIIKFAKPLSIVVAFYNEKDKSMDELTIDVKSIVDGTFEFTPMIRVEESK